MSESLEVACGDDSVTAVRYPASGAEADKPVLILAHGAGAGQASRFMVQWAAALAERGLETVTFNFPYSEKGRKGPDAPAVLESCYRAVVDRVAASGRGRALFIGGKSMGGRIATQIAAAGSLDVVDGLVLLGYPLHPPGKPQQLRTAHLPKIKQPMLVVQGSRDAFGTPQELSPVLDALSASTELMVIEGGDHSFSVPKSSGVPQLDIYAKIWDAIITWTSRIAAKRADPESFVTSSG